VQQLHERLQLQDAVSGKAGYGQLASVGPDGAIVWLKSARSAALAVGSAGPAAGAWGAAAALLTSVGGVPRLLPRMWASLASHADVRAFLLDASEAVARLPGLASSLTLFCTALAHVLLATDDIAFFERGVPLPLPVALEVLTFVRNLLYRLTWTDREATQKRLSHRPVAVLQLMSSAARVFNQLYDRHARRPGALCKEEDWLWPALSPTDLSVDTVMGLAEADAAPDEAMRLQALPPTLGAEEGEGDDSMGGHPAAASVAAPSPGSGAGAGTVYYGMRGLQQSKALLVLTTFPQVIPFLKRVALFEGLRQRDEELHMDVGPHGMFQARKRWRFDIHRSRLVQDSFRAFRELARQGSGGQALKDSLQITFFNKEGLPEAG
jgi:hypothetical protein